MVSAGSVRHGRQYGAYPLTGLQNEFARTGFFLLRHWDPIEIGENPNLADEYDEYIQPVIALLERGVDTAAIAAFLESIEAELGINLPRERRATAAKALKQDITPGE